MFFMVWIPTLFQIDWNDSEEDAQKHYNTERGKREVGCIHTIASVLVLEIFLEDKSDLTEVPIPLSTDIPFLESK
jgi:hypothetical protein